MELGDGYEPRPRAVHSPQKGLRGERITIAFPPAVQPPNFSGISPEVGARRTGQPAPLPVYLEML